MTIVFVSNCFNHHERYLCDELYKHNDVEFYFIQTTPLSEERKKMGWSIDLKQFPYCLCSYKEKEKCSRLINECDALIIGSAPFEIYSQRLKEQKLSFYYCESFFKQGFWHILNPKTFLSVLKSYIYPSKNPNIYMLCASAFTPLDCHRIYSFKDRCFRWGHFIKVNQNVDVKELLQQKDIHNRKIVRLLWVGRLIALKHPEMPIKVAIKLKMMSVPFTMEIIGIGPLEEDIAEKIKKNKLENQVHLLGSMSPTEVRKHMEVAGIYMFTSDRNEGWGAVLGEAMSSGCAVVTGSTIGATPFLVQHNVNGLVYEGTNYFDFEQNVVKLALNSTLRKQLGIAAAMTMQSEWSPNVAADRFYKTVKSLLNNQRYSAYYENGPMSKAPVINRSWFKKEI